MDRNFSYYNNNFKDEIIKFINKLSAENFIEIINNNFLKTDCKLSIEFRRNFINFFL